MPSTSRKQARAMAAAAHGESKLGIPRDVAKEFHEADKKTSILKGKQTSPGKRATTRKTAKAKSRKK